MRDDIHKLGLPPEAVSYARGKGMAFLKKKPRASRAEIVEAMDGNLCRCGAHVRILDAVESAGKAMGGVR